VSDAEDNDDPDARRSASRPAPASPPRKVVDEDDLDLDDLDRDGVAGVVARMRGGDDAPVDPPVRRVARGRTPALSVVVAAIGTYLLVTMFSDFRYWLRSAEPRDLGNAAEIVKDGRMPPGLHDHYVRIAGTPDVQHAARMTTKAGYVGYLRINEGGGSLFAAIPRGKDEAVRDEFEGVFTGRMLELDRDAGADWIEQYLRDENIVRTVDTDLASLVSAIEASGDRRTFRSEHGATDVGVGERVRVVVHPPDARVQLGLDSFRTPEDAQRAVSALGLPFVSLGEGKAFHSFLVRIPEAERAAVAAKLAATVGQTPDAAASNPDPRKGVVVLPGTVAFSAALGDYALAGDDVLLPRGGAGGPVLYDVVGMTLVPRGDRDGFVVVPRDWIAAVRVEQPILLDRAGYLVVVGDTPSKHRLTGILWLVIATLVSLNVASLVKNVRARMA
jgi:hypothetical protein